ncbi:MAG: tRNA 2-selenouridine(34) synthase MnmH [Saprospiraceae bacterium]
MIDLVSPEEFLKKQAEGLVLLDTRSPGEFEQGRVIGAQPLPLFSDEERAQVGTTYKKKDPKQAFLEGLEIVGPKLRWLVEEAAKYSQKGGLPNEIGVYCWRGGDRSASVSILLEKAGFKVTRLKGGYKAYRNHGREYLENLPHTLTVVDGSTGSGKTVLLHELKRLGAQVLDLEGIANHRGSAFGLVPGTVQPSSEHATNLIFDELRKFDVSKTVWAENESRNIGSVFLPHAINDKLADSHRLMLIVPREDRLAHIVDMYGAYPPAEIIATVEKIQKRLGGLAAKQAIEAANNGDAAAVADLVLAYYDKAYAHYSARQEVPSADRVEVRFEGLGELAKGLV